MKWIDYRAALGIGVNDTTKFRMLKNKIIAFLDGHSNNFKDTECYKYAIMVGDSLTYFNSYNVRCSITNEKSTNGLISKCIAFYNCCENRIDYNGIHPINIKAIYLQFLKSSLYELNIPFEIVEDSDGIFIFPKGAKELDDALVSEPLEWLKGYPKSRTAFIKALKDYVELNDDNASDVADKLRKALEAFFQEFFGGGKTLENYKSDYGTYLKDQGVPTEISNNFAMLLKSYTDYINNYAKHHDKSEKNVLEYLLYQTGNIVRLLITLKQGGIQNAD